MLATVLSVLAVGWYAIILSICLVGCVSARRRYAGYMHDPTPTGETPGVSILRPLRGLDPNLYENLETTFKQDYPNYEIIFSVKDEDDAALGVVHQLIARYPHVNARVIIGEELIGINPKLNNLIRSYRAAANDILWVLDSNAAVHPTTLGISIRTLTSSSPSSKRISVVHHVPLATLASSSRRTIGTRLEEAFLNTTHAKMYVALNTLAPDSCVMGKSNIYRRSDVESVDADIAAARRRARNPSASGPSKEDAGPRGLVAFAPFLAEDNMIASALMHSLQTCHSLSHNTVHTSLGSMSLGAYISRRTRWIRVRKRMVLTATLLEPFTESILAGALMSAGLRYLVGTGFWTVWVIHMVAWLCIDLLTCRALDGDGWDQASFVAAWFGREVLTLPIFLWAVFGSEVVWRGQTYKMLWNGYCEIVEKDPNQGASWFGSWFGASRGKGDYRPLPAVRP